MNISILHYISDEYVKGYGIPENYKILMNAAKELGHKVRMIRKSDCQLDFTNGKQRILYKNKPFPKTDVIITRAGMRSNYEMEAGTIKHFQSCGFTIVNKYLPVISCKNKIRTLQYLQKNNIPIPKTIVVQDRQYMEQAIEENLDNHYPLLIKAASGTLGSGVLYISDSQSLASIMDTLMEVPDNEFLIQEFLEESRGKDVRVFIVGGKIIAAIERIASDDFDTNHSKEAIIKPTELTHEEKTAALNAAKAIGIEVAGVDLMRTSSGPRIIEVNANPGLEGITKATGIDVASAIIKYAVKKAKSEQTKKENKTTKIAEKMKK